MPSTSELSMMPVFSNGFLATTKIRPVSSQRRKMKTINMIPDERRFQVGFYDLTVEWSLLRGFSRQGIMSRFIEGIKLCHQERKDEFVITNIAPFFIVGNDDPSALLEIQDYIVSVFTEAMVWQHRDAPVFRLARRGNEFDVRFYLGRTRPTDGECYDDRD